MSECLSCIPGIWGDIACEKCRNRRKIVLKWTKEKPKKEGWYWLNEKGCHVVVQITAGGLISEPYVRHVNDVDGEWAGPIPEPMENAE